VQDPAELQAWHKQHIGINVQSWGGVGEENGGDVNEDRVSGGTQQTLILPNTGARLTLALTRTIPERGAVAPRVILPEVRIQPAARDIADGTDPVLRAATALIMRARAGGRANHGPKASGGSRGTD
jgi:hypothetical protein